MKKSVLEQYRQELHPLHEDFSQKLAQLFGDLMKGSDIPYALVEHRTAVPPFSGQFPVRVIA